MHRSTTGFLIGLQQFVYARLGLIEPYLSTARETLAKME